MTTKEMYEMPEYALALEKFDIIFMATHGGGRPQGFRDFSPDELEQHLQSLDFRIIGRRNSQSGSEWVSLSGGIDVCLYDGYVCHTKRRP